MPHSTEEDDSPNGSAPAPQDLGTPFHLDDFATPESSLSLAFGGDLLRLTRQLRINSPHSPLPPASSPSSPPDANLNADSNADANADANADMSALPGPGEPTPPAFGGQSLMVGIQRAFNASRRLQEAMGICALEGAYKVQMKPYARPPPMPEDLWEAFEEGWDEFGVDRESEDSDDADDRVHVGYEEELGLGSENDSSDSLLSQVFYSNEGLDREEKGFGGNEHISATDVASGSGTMPLQPSFLPRLPEPRKRMPKNLGLNRTNSLLRGPSQSFFGTADVHANIYNPGFARDSAHNGPFPSKPLSYPFSTGGAAPRESSLSLNTNTNRSAFFSTLFQGPPSFTSTPEPEEDMSSRNRPDSRPDSGNRSATDMPSCSQFTSSSSSLPMPAFKKQRGHPIPVGLPSVPRNNEWAWKSSFPGNTPGLANELLTWHTTLRNMYAKAINPELMRIHPMFPYPPCEPTHVPLISASFWDTSVEPHKELWRIGPGDVEVLSYNTVDTFFETGEVMVSRYGVQGKKEQVPRIKRLFSNNKGAYTKDMRDRALTGEGRWCFLVIKGKPDGRVTGVIPEEDAMDEDGKKDEEDIPPFVVLAFPSSAITRSSECLHILYPDSSPGMFPRFQPAENHPNGHRKGKRLSSLPILNPAIRRASSMFLPTPLRSSSAALPTTTNRSSLHIPTGQSNGPQGSAHPAHRSSIVNLSCIPTTSSVANPNSHPPVASANTNFNFNFTTSNSPSHLPVPGVPPHNIPLGPRSDRSPHLSPSPLPHSLPPTPESAQSHASNNHDAQSLTVRRTLLWFEKAGYVPLVEGYRTDMSAWRPFLEAVGQGKGKIVLFGGVEGKGITY